MVEILPPSKNLGSFIGQKIAGGFQSGLSKFWEDLAEEDQLKMKNELALQQSNALRQKLKDLGVPDNVADLYADPNTTGGGKTAILQNLMELESRGLLGKGIFNQNIENEEDVPTFENRINQNQEQNFKFPKLPNERGLKSNEIVARENSREKTNIPLYNTAKEKSRNLFQEGLSLNRLEQLNNSGKLPEGLGRINVHPKSGELVLPFLANPETQLFIKTINDFTTKAKDSYGARVTNFELDRFMKRLPGPLNSPQGRSLVIKQMQIINALNELDQKSLVDTFDHYGVSKINAQKASQISDEYKRDKERELLQEYSTLDGLLNQIPSSKSSSKNERKSLEDIFS